MASSRNYTFLALALCSVLLFHACSAQHETQEQQPGARRQWQQQNECQIRRINPQEPDRSIKSEAGVTEVWDENDDQFQCAGVAAVRHTIEQRGLLLPAYSNAPKLIYVDQGRGFHGAAFPGCPETYQSEEESQQEQRQGSRDQHQKVREIRRGDVIAIPAGVVDWFYNDAQSPLVLVQIFDTSSSDNQLDQNFRKFFLAGNPQRQIQGQRRDQSSSPAHLYGRGGESTRRGGQQEQQQHSGNIFQAFDEQFLAEAFNIDTDLARRIKSQNDNRGIIVRVEEQLEFLSPEFSQQEEREFRGSGRYSNGIEETYCTAKLKQNINDPSRADIFNPRAGRLTTVNRFSLPILRYLQLSAQKGHLYRNAIMAPHWNMNAHSINYITRGSGQIQIVNENGERVFDGQVQEGQIITSPQNFAVVKRAGNEGLEWISFKTNDNAKISQIAGRASTIRAIPQDVIANSFGISLEEARRIKFNRDEIGIFSPGTRSRFGRN